MAEALLMLNQAGLLPGKYLLTLNHEKVLLLRQGEQMLSLALGQLNHPLVRIRLELT